MQETFGEYEGRWITAAVCDFEGYAMLKNKSETRAAVRRLSDSEEAMFEGAQAKALLAKVFNAQAAEIDHEFGADFSRQRSAGQVMAEAFREYFESRGGKTGAAERDEGAQAPGKEKKYKELSFNRRMEILGAVMTLGEHDLCREVKAEAFKKLKEETDYIEENAKALCPEVIFDKEMYYRMEDLRELEGSGLCESGHYLRPVEAEWIPHPQVLIRLEDVEVKEYERNQFIYEFKYEVEGEGGKAGGSQYAKDVIDSYPAAKKNITKFENEFMASFDSLQRRLSAQMDIYLETEPDVKSMYGALLKENKTYVDKKEYAAAPVAAVKMIEYEQSKSGGFKGVHPRIALALKSVKYDEERLYKNWNYFEAPKKGFELFKYDVETDGGKKMKSLESRVKNEDGYAVKTYIMEQDFNFESALNFHKQIAKERSAQAERWPSVKKAARGR